MCKGAWADFPRRSRVRAKTCGVEIRREVEVKRILASSGRATGVQLASGAQIDADVVASSVDAHLTFEKMLQTRGTARGVSSRDRTDRLRLGFGQSKRGLGRTADSLLACLAKE